MATEQPANETTASARKMNTDALDIRDIIETFPNATASVTADAPPTVRIVIDGDTIPESVQSVLDKYDATIVDASCTEASLVIHARPSPVQHIGERTMRKWGGGSVVVAFPHEALGLSGLGLGDEVRIDATEDEIRLSHAES